jgi:putative Holliday junction resolvase
MLPLLSGDIGVRTGVRLGVDVGSVRVGVARSDPGGILASPLEVITHGRGDLDRLAGLVAEHDVLEVIIGLPTTLAGREGPAAAGAREVAAALAARIAPVAVRLFDERFTTTTAHAVLRQRGKNSRARRQVVDQAAAAVLLQAALDAERATGQPPGELVPQPGLQARSRAGPGVGPHAGGAAGRDLGSHAGGAAG